MDLILWRHAEALEMREVEDDLDRALTPKGERQAQRMATWLNRQLPSSTRVLASPARRCQQTVAALDRKVKTVPALAPDGTVEGLLHAVRWPDAREPVLAVGHQPILGLAFALGRECAVEVFLHLAHLEGFGVAPEDQVHARFQPRRCIKARCALAPCSATRL
jgi:phosphohistidine phosphatase